MICPLCRRRYKWYETTCPDDGATLVEEPSPEKPLDLVRVFTTKEAGLLPLAEMALKAEHIEYFVHHGPSSVPMFTRHPSPDLNYPVDASQIVVRREDAQRAHELLVDLEQAGPVESSTLAPTPAEWEPQPDSNIELIDSDTKDSIGRVTEDQLRQLQDALEEDADAPDEYYIGAGTIDVLEEQGVDPAVITMLRTALGEREGMQVRWVQDN
jgi:hypothetical protein